MTNKEERRKIPIPRYRSESQAGSSGDKELLEGGEGQLGSDQDGSKRTRRQRFSKGQDGAGGAGLGRPHEYDASHPGEDRRHTPASFLPERDPC